MGTLKFFVCSPIHTGHVTGIITGTHYITILLKFHIQFTWEWKIKYIIIICIDRASKEKKRLSPKELTSCPKKITIMKISIMYADFFNKIHQKWPTELGMKKC